MTADQAFKLRAGDTVQRQTPTPATGIVRGRRGHLLYIEWHGAQAQHLLTYDAQNIERHHPEAEARKES